MKHSLSKEKGSQRWHLEWILPVPGNSTRPLGTLPETLLQSQLRMELVGSRPAFLDPMGPLGEITTRSGSAAHSVALAPQPPMSGSATWHCESGIQVGPRQEGSSLSSLSLPLFSLSLSLSLSLFMAHLVVSLNIRLHGLHLRNGCWRGSAFHVVNWWTRWQEASAVGQCEPADSPSATSRVPQSRQWQTKPGRVGS